ncbi:hypothetical protein WG66_002169 [Moniliophthora roreri]|nr:hypothetical protein WG66_002169 [Moniliophthora roreri]
MEETNSEKWKDADNEKLRMVLRMMVATLMQFILIGRSHSVYSFGVHALSTAFGRILDPTGAPSITAPFDDQEAKAIFLHICY